jgi:hypothetical protein
VRRLRELQLERVDRLLRRRDRDGEGALLAAKLDELELALIQAERDTINRLLREGKITDETRRRIERELDLREEAIRRGVRSYEASNT